MKQASVLALCCLLGRPALAAWQRNFADNPSAEADRNRDGLPDGWRPAVFKSPATTAWDAAVAHAGAASLRISNSFNPKAKTWDERTGRWIAAARHQVAPGKTYTLSVWIKTKGVTGQATACIAWWGGSSWLAESYTQRLSGTADWRRVTVQAKAPPKADAAQVYLCLSNSKGTAWFDDVVAIEGTALPSNFRPVDMARLCNAGFRDDTAGDGKGGWTDQGPNDIRSLPVGSVLLRGIPFRILDPAKNDGKSCIVLRGKGRASFPKSVAIPLGRKCETLYFLHCCAWGRKGAPVGRYELLYESGRRLEFPLKCDRQVHDWWRVFDTADAAAAWEGANAETNGIGLGMFPLVNPKPKDVIKEIRFVAAPGDPVPILVALTTADGPPVLTERPVRYEFTDTTGWYPFNFPLDDTNLDTIDLTRFLDPPAGKHGFLTVRDDGHFYFQDGTRARFFGTNLGGPYAFPTKDKAPIIAGRLAKYGVNLLRIHAIDGRWGPLIDYAKGNSRSFNPDALDRLDFFFAELKKRGIYVYFDLLDYRRFLPGDGVRDAAKFQHGWRNSIKGATIFNDRLIELQKEFATNFLTHRNPYARLRYVDDPAFAVLEITNENSVFYFRNTTLTLPTYVGELRERWNRWLTTTHGDRAKLATAWTRGGQRALLPDEDPAKGTVFLPMRHLYQDPASASFVGHRSPARVDAMVRFFVGLERRYYGAMRAHLKQIGVQVPITGTNQTFCPASTYADSINDFMSRNNYWQHPNVHAKPFVRFNNVAVVSSDLRRVSNPIAAIASSTVVGKPMISPEFNFPWPNEYRAECLPLMAAYACLQDWDGLLFFAYRPDGKALEHFVNQSDPVRWGQFPAAALLFHRNDVSVARNTIHIGYSSRDVFTGRPSHRRAKSSHFRHWPYLSKVRNVYLDDVDKARPKLVRGTVPVPPTPKRFVSDTGQLALDHGRGLFTIDTPRTKAAVGFLAKAGPVKLGGVTIECRTPFAAVMVTSLDAKPIGESRRILVTAVARAENTGQAFSQNHSAIPEKGRPPVLAEPVAAAVTLPVPDAPGVFRLDETGKRGKRVPADFEGGTIRLPLGGAHSPWCEVVVIPPTP